MDETAYQVRAFQPPDYADHARLAAQIHPAYPTTKEEIERVERVFFTPPLVLHKIVAEARSTGRAIGIGWLYNDPEAYDPSTFWVDVWVERDHQGRGVGRALAEHLWREADRRQASRLWAGVYGDDPRAWRFFQLHGFVEKRRSWRSRLDVGTAVRPPNRDALLRQQGVSFLTAADLDLGDPAVVRALYDLNLAVSADEPRLGVYAPITLDQFVQTEIGGPAYVPDAYFLARADGRFIASSALRRLPGDSDAIVQSFTGTLREYRGRGIATELKRRGIEYALAHGYRSILTGNDSLNGPILAINRKLGFQPERERVVGEWRRGG